MPNSNQLLEKIIMARSAIEAVDFQVQQDQSDAAIESAIEYAIICIEAALPHCTDENAEYKQPLSDCLLQMKSQLKAYTDDSHLYINLRNAIGFSNRTSLDEFDIDNIICMTDDIKDSDNIYDKLALAILYSCLGSECYPDAIELFKEYLNSNKDNPFISQGKILSLLEKVSE